MIVELDIFYLKEQQVINENIGVETPWEECSLKKVAFVNIDYFCARTDVPEYTIIGSSNEEFTCKDSYDVVMRKIQQATIFYKFN